MPREDPLTRYAGDPSLAPVMREIARIALAKKFSQQSLASRLGYTPPAIIKHFRTARPSWPVITAYAQALSVNVEYFGLLATPPRPLASDRRKYWLNILKTRLTLHEKRLQRFKPGTTRAAMSAYGSVPPDERVRALEAFVLAEYRQRTWFFRSIRSEWEGEAGLEAFADAMIGYFDLHSQIRRRVTGEEFLAEVWWVASRALTVTHADQLVDLARVLLEREEADPSQIKAMIQFLQSDEIYTKYHERS